jgi:hypothetical protein
MRLNPNVKRRQRRNEDRDTTDDGEGDSMWTRERCLPPQDDLGSDFSDAFGNGEFEGFKEAVGRRASSSRRGRVWGWEHKPLASRAEKASP